MACIYGHVAPKEPRILILVGNQHQGQIQDTDSSAAAPGKEETQNRAEQKELALTL